MHGLNGLDPTVSYKLWNTYIASQLFYGLEATGATEKHILKIETYQCQVFRQLQHLPQKTSTAAVYLLIGAMPAEGVYHRRLLCFICNIIREEDSTEAKIIRRQAAVKDLTSHSLVSNVRTTLAKYGLPSIYELLDNPPSSGKWKAQVKAATQKYWTEKLIQEARKRSSLKYLDLGNCKIGRPHPLWDSTTPLPRDVTRAAVKAKLITGTYTLQCHRAMYSQNKNQRDSYCQLCQEEPENREHFLVRCTALFATRSPYLQQLKELLIPTTRTERWDEIVSDKHLLTQLILDPSSTSLHLTPGKNLYAIEHCTRRLCFALHCNRSALLGINPTTNRPQTKIL